MRHFTGMVGLFGSMVLLAAACGSGPSTAGSGGPSPTPSASASPSASPSATASPSASSQFFQLDQANKTVSLTLISSFNNTAGGFNFDGFANGAMKVTVPIGWKVDVTCANHGAVNHSCVIAADATATSPVFPGASSTNPMTGVAKGQQQTFSFSPDKAGNYRIVCLVPGHESAGMWDAFDVISSGVPAFTTS